MWIFLLILGGFFNLYKFHSRFGGSSDMPNINQGYIAAFAMGAIIYGGGMCLLYAVFK
jgi:hypothetical protein